jgi:hypothetical protein
LFSAKHETKINSKQQKYEKVFEFSLKIINTFLLASNVGCAHCYGMKMCGFALLDT